MVGVTIDSGQFPLMRDADADHQPTRARMYSAWSKAFKQQVPWALDAIADVIEDVYTYKLWEDNYLDTPQEFFHQIGLGDLDFSEPQALIEKLRSMPADTPKDMVVKELGRDGVRGLGKKNPKRIDNIKAFTEATGGGTSKEYLIARIARDFPDLDVSGFKSVRQAAIHCGIVKEASPYQLLVRAWGKASEEERNQFMADYG